MIKQNDEEIIIELLEKVARLPKDQEFNAFKELDIDENEVIMCRFLYTLLKSDGAHGCGRTFIDLFFDKVLNVEKPSGAITVDKEVPITVDKEEAKGEKERRIDIVLKYDDDDVVLPIEAKINAREGKDQCADYIKHAKNSKLYYLTIDGNTPGDYKDYKEQIKCISWKVDIHKWLLECIAKTDKTENNAYFYDLLCQYAKVVKDFKEEDPALMSIIKSDSKYEPAADKISMASSYLRDENQDVRDMDIIDIIQSTPEFTEAAKRIARRLKVSQIKSVPIKKIDEKLQKEHGFKLYDGTSLWKTYYTDKEDVFLRLQYKPKEPFKLVVCFIEEGEKNPVGLNGKWAFEEISDNDFDSLYEDEYLNGCVAKIVKKLEELKNL